MIKNILINIKQKILIFFVIIFSLLINQYYGNLGVFPVDSFSHFDTGYKILLGEYPFKDYWLVSGPIVDYIQAIFFYLFGVNWQSYVFHASFFNAVLAISLTTWSPFARIARAETLTIRNSEYILAAKVQGASTFRIILNFIFCFFNFSCL